MLQIHKTEGETSTLCYKKYKGTQGPVIIYEIIPVNSQIIQMCDKEEDNEEGIYDWYYSHIKQQD